MNPLFRRYSLDFPKLSKANHLIVSDRILIYLRKDTDGNSSLAYGMYDYETKILLGFFFVDKKTKEKDIDIKFYEDSIRQIDWSKI